MNYPGDLEASLAVFAAPKRLGLRSNRPLSGSIASWNRRFVHHSTLHAVILNLSKFFFARIIELHFSLSIPSSCGLGFWPCCRTRAELSKRARRPPFAGTSGKNRFDGTKSDFVAILQVSLGGKDAIDLYSVR